MMTREFIVSGRVQGVGFRWFVARHARRLGLAGYARNRADGSVEVMVSGPDEALVALERMLHEGPELARVAAVSVRDMTTEESFPSFDIRR
jgi:acylphosphatase